MGKKVFVNGPGLYWYDGMTFKKLRRPVKYGYESDFVIPKVPLFCLTAKKRWKFIEKINDFATAYGKYQYYRGHDDAVDEILDDVE